MTAEPVRRQVFLRPKARVRRAWFLVHKWLGLALLVVMTALGLTGSALVWPEAVERAVYPARAVAEARLPFVPEGSRLAEARAALGGAPVAAVRYPAGGMGAVAAGEVAAPPKWGVGPPTRPLVYIDPADGRVLDVTPSTGGFMWYMHAIHGHLALREVGREVVGVMGVLLLVSSVSGIYLWWPGRKRLLKGLAWQKREGVAMNLHRQTGAILALALIVEAATGIWISFPAVFEMLVEPGKVASGHHEGPPAAPALTAPALDFAEAARRAQALEPGRIISIFAPTEASPVWRVQMDGRTGPAVAAIPDSGEQGSVTYPTEKAGPADDWTHAMQDVHYGRVGGLVWQLLVFLSGIILALLSTTGLLIWLRPRRRKA